MMPQAPAATPAPLHDIAGPLSIFPYPLWVVILGAIGLLALIGLGIWLTRRRRSVRPLTPRQRAMATINALRQEGVETDGYAFGVRVSDALRAYIRDQHGLDAVTRTSVEFLDVLRGHTAFTDNEKGALSEFLEAVDLLKFARQDAAPQDVESLLSLAERLVSSGEPGKAKS